MNYKSIKRRILFFRALSNLISYLLHPLLMPSLIFFTVFYFCPMAIDASPQFKSQTLIVIFVTTFIFPVLSTFVLFYVMKKNFSVVEMHIKNKEDRFYPFLFTGLFYAAITYMFFQSRYDLTMVAIMGGIALSVLLVAGITYFWKISAHAVGICGALGYIIIISYYYPYELMLYPVAVLAFLAGLLLSARLNLNAHSPSQVFSGALLGLVISIFSFVIFKSVGLFIFF